MIYRQEIKFNHEIEYEIYKKKKEKRKKNEPCIWYLSEIVEQKEISSSSEHYASHHKFGPY